MEALRRTAKVVIATIILLGAPHIIPSIDVTIIGSLGASASPNECSYEPLRPPELPQRPLWRYETGGQIFTLAISADGSYTAAGGYENVIYLLRSDNVLLWSYRTNSSIHSVAISADGSYIAVGNGEGVYFFSRDSSTPLWIYPLSDDYAYSVSISSDGSYIVAGCLSGLYLFSRSSSSPLWSYHTKSRPPKVAISSDGSHLVAAGGWLYLFSRSGDTPLWIYPNPRVRGAAISPDGNYITATGNEQIGSEWFGVVYLFSRSGSKTTEEFWDPFAEKMTYKSTPLWSYPIGHGPESHPGAGLVSISLDGNYIVTSGSFPTAEEAAGGCPPSNNKIYLFSRSDNVPIWVCDAGYVESISISSDGSYIATTDRDEGLQLFSYPSSTPLWRASGRLASISSDGNYVAASPHSQILLFSKGLVNNPPSLIAGKVSPLSGTWDENIFVYEVTYSDADNDSPLWRGYCHNVVVYIDGSAYNMTHETGDYTTGGIFKYRWWPTSENIGQHTYYFETSDGYVKVRLPASGEYSGPTVREARALTTLTVTSPPEFDTYLTPGRSVTIAATLTSGGNALTGKLIDWSTNVGNIAPPSATTDSTGKVMVSYTAPSYPADITITASFVGDNEYKPSSTKTFCHMFFEVTLTFHDPNGNPLYYAEIYYGYSKGDERILLGVTDSNGKIRIIEEPEHITLTGHTIYFKTPDGKYAGSTSVGTTVAMQLSSSPKFQKFPSSQSWGSSL